MVKIFCYFLFFGSLWSFFEENLLLEELEGMCSYYVIDLCLQLIDKMLEKFFLGDLLCIIFFMIVMEVDENNGLGFLEVM